MKPFALVRAILLSPAVKLGLSVALAGIPIFGPATSYAQTPPPVFPEVGPTTHFVNQQADGKISQIKIANPRHRLGMI